MISKEEKEIHKNAQDIINQLSVILLLPPQSKGFFH